VAPGGTVALHHAVVQQVAGAGVGERGTLELHRVHLVDETARHSGKEVRTCCATPRSRGDDNERN